MFHGHILCFEQKTSWILNLSQLLDLCYHIASTSKDSNTINVCKLIPVWLWERVIVQLGLFARCRGIKYTYFIRTPIKYSWAKTWCYLVLQYIVMSDKEIMFSVAFDYLSGGLLATLLTKLWTDCDEIYRGVWSGKSIKWLNFGGDPDHQSDIPIRNPHITQQIVSGVWWNFQDSAAMCSNDIRNSCSNFRGDLNHHADSSNHDSRQWVAFAEICALWVLIFLVCNL